MDTLAHARRPRMHTFSSTEPSSRPMLGKARQRFSWATGFGRAGGHRLRTSMRQALT